MAMFVHIAAEKHSERIRRGGLSKVRAAWGSFPGGVFAVPVTPNFFLTHQWLRELKRSNEGPLVGVYFRIPDDEQVWLGHYGQNHCWMSAAKAVAVFTNGKDLCGWEVVIPRRIGADELHRIRDLPQVVGWRYMPGAHGVKPCGCDYCQRGQYGARRLRERYNAARSG
jgi:hypothetical protein